MASPLEAFERLRSWKKSNAVLRVTVVESGVTTDQYTGQIVGVDEEQFLVGVVLRATRDHFQLDLSDATFKVGGRTLEAERGENEFVAFEEL